MNDQSNPESIVQAWLDQLKDDPPPDPRVVARARAQFLTQAVSADEFQSHNGWKSIFRKEQFAMNLLVSIVVIAGLLAGGGMTVKASQNDLPGEPLYAVKTFSENVSLDFQNSPDAKVERLLELAQTRVQEMSRMVEAGQTPPDQVRQRLDQHLQQAFQICSNMEDAALDRTLRQVRDQLQQQERDMERLQTHAGPTSQPILEQTRTMLQERLQLASDGLQNHEMFRNTVRNGFHFGSPTSVPSTPVAPSGQQNGQATPQAGPGPNGQQNGTCTPQAGPGSGNGPGPNTSVTPMQNQNQNQNQTQNQNKSGNGSGSGGGSGGNGSGGSGSGGSGSGGSGSGGNHP